MARRKAAHSITSCRCPKRSSSNSSTGEIGEFAETFDDEGAKKGWCLFKLGCKGPVTYNACATIKWNNGAGWPVEGGHGCLGCSEPGFWDWGGFYKPLSQGVDVLPAYTLGHSFKGEGLGTTWSDPNARSSFVGHFAY